MARIRFVSLVCGVVVPVGYFGIQMASAPFYPGYSFVADDASTLGSPGSNFPALFNWGSILVGVLLACSLFGIVQSLLFAGARKLVAWGVFTALCAGVIACVNGGVFPLPDKRHVSGPMANIGSLFFLLPFLLPFMFPQNLSAARPLRTYFIVNLFVLFALIPIVSGLIQRGAGLLDIELVWYQGFLNHGSGVLQRIAAAVVFVPIGVLSCFLLNQSGNHGTRK